MPKRITDYGRMIGVSKKTFSFLLFLSLIFMLYIPVSATTTDEHSISTNAGTAELTHKNDIGITLPVGEVTKVKNIENNILVNNKYDGPWQETCIDGAIVYCESGAELKIAEPYNYGDDGSMYEFRFYFGSIKPAEISRYHNVQLPDTIDTSGYSHAQVKRITGDICLVEYWDSEIDDAGNIESLSTSFEGTHQLPDGTYYIEMIGAETRKDNSYSVHTYPSAQFVVVVGETSSSTGAATFSDVPSNAYYADAVRWAVEQGITVGTSSTTFSPDATCNRAQILSFLWRANGSPEPTIRNPFQDIKDSDYFYKAALWAAEKGMVSGSIFDPAIPCTRASTMEYMWKNAGNSNTTVKTNFIDIPADADYTQAVAWAINNGVTAGTSATTFSSDAICTRGQIVTFLYRYMA